MVEQKARTTCNRDCPDACGIVATLKDGVLVKIEGDKDHPVTKGFLCYRTSRFPELAASPARVAQPMIRRNDRLEPASWDEALDLIAKKLVQVREESGPEAIFHYRSGGSLGILKHLIDLFFDEFGPCTTKIGDICSGAGEAAQLTDFGTSDSNDLFDLLNSKHIVLWGKNAKVSNVHLVPILNDAKKKGAEVVSIDPLHHKSTSLADCSVQLRPGGDYELVMGVARTLFDTDCVDPKAREFCDNFDAFRALVHRHTSRGVSLSAHSAARSSIPARSENRCSAPTCSIPASQRFASCGSRLATRFRCCRMRRTLRRRSSRPSSSWLPIA